MWNLKVLMFYITIINIRLFRITIIPNMISLHGNSMGLRMIYAIEGLGEFEHDHSINNKLFKIFKYIKLTAFSSEPKEFVIGSLLSPCLTD